MLRDPKDVAEWRVRAASQYYGPTNPVLQEDIDAATEVIRADRAALIAEAKRVVANEKELVLGSEDGRTPGGFSVPLERALAALDAILKEKE